jgi:hypothetical protein
VIYGLAFCFSRWRNFSFTGQELHHMMLPNYSFLFTSKYKIVDNFFLKDKIGVPYDILFLCSTGWQSKGFQVA